MSGGVLKSDSIPEGTTRWGSFSLAAYTRPGGGGLSSGDRFEVRLTEEGLVFFLADAAGHGEKGAAFWSAHGDEFDRFWEGFVRGEQGLDRSRRFVRRLNQYLYDQGSSRTSTPLTHLCFAFGSFSVNGLLTFGNFGYGNHVLVSSGDGNVGGGTEKQWGLKLGWMPSGSWDSVPGAMILHQIHRVRRVVLLTDGFLGDDHADPDQAMRLVGELSEQCATVPLARVLPLVTELPHEADDATAVAIDLIAG